MFPLNKKEKRGKSWVIVLLLVPLVLTGITIVFSIYAGLFQGFTAGISLLIGIFCALWGLITFTTYLGKFWSHIILMLIALGFCFSFFWNYQQVANQTSPISQIGEIVAVLLFYILPPFLLFLPAPNAFLQYQREKSTRHKEVLEHQLNQIGEDH